VFLCERGYGIEVEWISQRVRKDDGTCALESAASSWATSTLKVDLDIDEDRNSPFCRIGLTVVGKPAASVMIRHRASAVDRPILAKLSCDRQQVGRRARVHQHRLAHANEFCELPFELFGEAPGGQPEIER